MKAFQRAVLSCALVLAAGSAARVALADPHPPVATSLTKSGHRASSASMTSMPSAEATNSVIVGYRPTAEAKAVDAALKLGAIVSRRAKTGGFTVLRVPSGTDVTAFIEELEDVQGVLYAEPNGLVHAASTDSNDPGFSTQWGLSRIGAPSAWDLSLGTGVKVAVIDTGVTFGHSDLLGRIDSVNDYDFVNLDSNAVDDQGHGTHVAGTIAATLNNGIGVAGVAPMCTILPIKVLDRAGYGTNDEVADGIKWAADHGADVINLSLGSGEYATVVQTAVEYATARDCVVVAAAGNDGVNAVYYPARLPNVIGVSATGRTDVWGSYSNYGSGIDVSAPGTDIYSTLMTGGYGFKTGTSMATPHVSGVVALIRSLHPTWTRTQVETQLIGTSLDLGSVGRDDFFGYGRVRAAEALGGVSDTFTIVSDDEIPGVDLPASPVSGALSQYSDLDDVYNVYMRRGQSLRVSLSGERNTDFDIFLYAPDAVSVEQTSAIVAYSERESYPDSFTFTAQETGHYHLDVYAYAGVGAYTLTYFIEPPVSVDGNDDIPGTAVGPSPQAGSLDATDVADVYAVPLRAGKRLTLGLTGPQASDFDLYLFSPGAGSVYSDSPFARSTATSSTESIVCTVPVTGTYYVSVSAYAGEGEYALSHLIENAAADDDVPGVVLPVSPVVDSLQAGVDGVDPDDVYRVALAQGQWVYFGLDSTVANADLHLLGPGATSVEPLVAGDVVASSATSGSVEWLLYKAQVAGDHYLDVRAVRGAGTYTLLHSTPVAQPSVSASGPVTIPYGGTARVAGSLVDDADAPVAHTEVTLYSATPDSPDRAAVASCETSADGTYSFGVSPRTATVYWVGYAGGPRLLPVRSGSVTVTPQAYVGNPVAPGIMKRAVYYRVYSYLKPRHTGGSYPLRIYRWRKVNGAWKSYGYVKAKAADFYSYSKCTASVRLTYTGKWRLRAYAPSDAGHRAAWSSGYDYVTVR